VEGYDQTHGSFSEEARSVSVYTGLEIHLIDGPLSQLATSFEGWSNLIRLGTAIAIRDNPEAPCSLHTLASYSKDLIAIAGRPEQLKDLFPKRLYINLQDPSQANFLSGLANRLALPTVMTHPIYHLTPDQAVLQRTLTAVRLNKTIITLPKDAAVAPNAYFLSAQEMGFRFKDCPRALMATMEIAERCKFDLPIGSSQMPMVPLPEGITASQYLKGKSILRSD